VEAEIVELDELNELEDVEGKTDVVEVEVDEEIVVDGPFELRVTAAAAATIKIMTTITTETARLIEAAKFSERFISLLPLQTLLLNLGKNQQIARSVRAFEITGA
jgi:hypothetical protein